MTTKSIDWTQTRMSNPRLASWYTTRSGLAALNARGITLHPYLPFGLNSQISSVDVRRNGRLAGVVYCPMNNFHPFSAHSRLYAITDRSRHSTSVDSGIHMQFDDAVSAILRHWATVVPRPLQPSIVTLGRGCRSRVYRAYTGKKFNPTADMSSACRAADSIATRIRMNAAKIDPITGSKIVRAAVLSEPEPAPVGPSRLMALYRGMMKVHRKRNGNPEMLDKHIRDLALSPEHHHRLVIDHMLPCHTSGLHIGNKKAIEMTGAQTWATHAAGQTIAKDRPNERVGGVWYPKLRQLVLPDDTYSGSVSTGSHELGHALDFAWGAKLSGVEVSASHLPHFQQVYAEVTHMHDNSKTLLTPYYTDESTSDGPQEMWAEGYAAWLHGRDMYRTEDEQALLIGHEIGAAPSEKLRVGRILKRYFDLQDEKMRSNT